LKHVPGVEVQVAEGNRGEQAVLVGGRVVAK
jgi:hypothetical protein